MLGGSGGGGGPCTFGISTTVLGPRPTVAQNAFKVPDISKTKQNKKLWHEDCFTIMMRGGGFLLLCYYYVQRKGEARLLLLCYDERRRVFIAVSLL